jgi:hypothetical protein
MSMILLGVLALGEANALAQPPAVAERPAIYSLVGFIDLNGDGISDRITLHELVRKVGVFINDEVDDNGVRKPAGAKITNRTKYLIVGTIIDPAKVTDKSERQAAERVLQQFEKMQDEARKAGVRILRLTDILSFGHRRGWPDSIKNGGKTSTGKTSGIYKRSTRLRQPDRKS